MNVSFDYFSLVQQPKTCPSWVKCENYFNCASFSKFFSFPFFKTFLPSEAPLPFRKIFLFSLFTFASLSVIIYRSPRDTRP